MAFFKSQNKSILPSLGISLVLALSFCVLYFHASGSTRTWIHFLEKKILDIQFTQIPRPIAPDPSVVIVAINDKTLHEMEPTLGRWPWPRRTMGEIIAYLHDLSVAAIGVDILYPERNLRDPDGDAYLAQQIQKFGRVILAADFPDKGGALLPFPHLLDAAAGVGGIHLTSDLDGTTRSSRLWYSVEGKSYPSFPLAVGFQSQKKSSIQGLNLVSNSLLINWYGANGSFPYIEAYKLLEARRESLDPASEKKLHLEAARFFKDKIVLIGVTGAGLFDLRVTPFSPVYPGVEVNATILSNLLQGHFISALSSRLSVVYVLFISLVAAFFVSRFKSSFAEFLTGFTLMLLIVVFGFCLFHFKSIWAPVALPLICVFMISAGHIIWNYFTVGREKRFLREAFSKYLNEEVLKQLLEDPKNLELGGKNEELTILFSDIRGFTAFSEKLRPDEVVSLLNEYLSAMVDIVFEYGGTLDKFIGDAVMAFWGAPVRMKDHADLALKAGLAMILKTSELREKWLREGKPRLAIGIGINTGVVTVGNIGSEKSQSYTVIGDEVNLTSRLESLNKDFKTELIVSESTFQKISDKTLLNLRDLGEVFVKGKEKPVRIFGD